MFSQSSEGEKLKTKALVAQSPSNASGMIFPVVLVATVALVFSLIFSLLCLCRHLSQGMWILTQTLSSYQHLTELRPI